MGPQEFPEVIVPFPPEITPEEIVSRRSLKKLQSRPPNKYFIYRLTYLKQLKKLINRNKLSMTRISPHISKSWHAERIEVRDEYKRLADQVGELLKVVRKESFVVIAENPAPRILTPPTPPIENEPLSEQDFHSLFSLYIGF